MGPGQALGHQGPHLPARPSADAVRRPAGSWSLHTHTHTLTHTHTTHTHARTHTHIHHTRTHALHTHAGRRTHTRTHTTQTHYTHTLHAHTLHAQTHSTHMHKHTDTCTHIHASCTPSQTRGYVHAPMHTLRQTHTHTHTHTHTGLAVDQRGKGPAAGGESAWLNSSNPALLWLLL